MSLLLMPVYTYLSHSTPLRVSICVTIAHRTSNHHRQLLNINYFSRINHNHNHNHPATLLRSCCSITRHSPHLVSLHATRDQSVCLVVYNRKIQRCYIEIYAEINVLQGFDPAMIEPEPTRLLLLTGNCDSRDRNQLQLHYVSVVGRYSLVIHCAILFVLSSQARRCRNPSSQRLGHPGHRSDHLCLNF